MAAIAEAQAASTTKLGPRKLNRLARRPATQLPSSPGMVSSFTPGSHSSRFWWSSPSMAPRTSSGSEAKLPARSSSRRSSGYMRRMTVR